MKYIRIFEEFIKTLPREKEELSDKTIDNILHPDFLKDKDEDIEDNLVLKTPNGSYIIKNWKTY